jgi:hypothetical protein
MLPTTRDLLQQAWVVDDLESAAARWSRTLGIGPFHMAEYTPEVFEHVEYRGRPGVLAMRTAICYAGSVQIELVQPIGAGPNCYRDTVPVGRDGFHHVCFWTHGLDADIARYLATGATVAVRGQVKRGPAFAYLDATAQLGCMVELLEYSERLAQLFERWRQACAAWRDGDATIVKP